MGLFSGKQKEMALHRVDKLAITLFLSFIAFAFADTLLSVYLNSFVKSEAIVGFILGFLNLSAFLSFFIIIPLIERSEKSKLYSISLLLFGVVYLLLSINRTLSFLLILVFVAVILHTIRMTSFGIMVRDKSSEKKLSRNEGIMYTFMNLALLLGPVISGSLAAHFGINFVFVLSAIFVLIAYFFFKISGIKDRNVKKKIDNNLSKNFLDFFKSKDRRLAYILGGGVNFWWSLIYVFVPLLIVRNGLGLEWVGYFLFIIIFPLIIFTYPFSKLAGKIGFKTVFKAGFFILSFSALMCFFSANIFQIIVFLAFSSIGLAMVESTTEAYFFDILPGKEELRFYGPYNTSIELNNFLAKTISATFLLFFPLNYIFLVFSFFMFVFFLISFKIRNVIELRRDGRKN